MNPQIILQLYQMHALFKGQYCTAFQLPDVLYKAMWCWTKMQRPVAFMSNAYDWSLFKSSKKLQLHTGKCGLIFLLISFCRSEDHCGCPYSVCEETVRCNDFDSVLPQCLRFNRSTAFHGSFKKKMRCLANQHGWAVFSQWQQRIRFWRIHKQW